MFFDSVLQLFILLIKMDTDTISIGDYIVIQRQKYTKLHKFSSLDSTVMLGKELLHLRNIASKPYSTTFKMVSKDGAKGRRMSTLEVCTDKSYLTENIIGSKVVFDLDNNPPISCK